MISVPARGPTGYGCCACRGTARHALRTSVNGTIRKRNSSASTSLELADETDLRLQLVPELLEHGFLREVDEVANLGGGCTAQVHDDIRVFVEDFRAAVHVTLEAALIDEPSRADALELLEDRARTRVEPQVRVLLITPLQILAHVVAERLPGLRLQPEGRTQHDVRAVVQDAVVVPELEVITVHCADSALLREDLAGLEHFCNETRALALRWRREKVQVLPDRSAHRARDADVVLQSAQLPLHRCNDEVGKHDLTGSCAHAVPLEELDAAVLRA